MEESGSCTINAPTIDKTPANYTHDGWVNASSSSDKATSGGSITLSSNKTYNVVLKLTDTTGPTITVSDFCISQAEYAAATDKEAFLLSKATITDSSGVDDDETTVTPTSLSLGSNTVTYNAADIYGNPSSKSIKVTVYKQIIDDISVVTSGDGIYSDSLNSGRYIYRGADPNNYLTFNGQTWRIISIESDGTYKIIYNGSTEILQQYHSVYDELGTFTDMAINTYLNDTYYDNIDGVYQNLIVNHRFNAGTISADRTSSSYYLSALISDESNSSVTVNVGLQTVSDYLMASTTSKCNTSSTAINSLYSGCRENNWMTITPSTAQYTMNIRTSSRVWHVETDGTLSYAGTLWNAKTEGVIRPVVYLSASTTVTGSGTSSDPYVINTACSSPSSYTCTIGTTSGYVNPQTLTITAKNSSGTTVTSGITYSFDASTYSSTNTKSVAAAGKYVGYIKDSSGLTNSCSVTLSSQEQWRKRSCAVDLTFTSWYANSLSYGSSCSAYSQSEAEANNSTWYRTCPESYIIKYSCQGSSTMQGGPYSSKTTANNNCGGYSVACGSTDYSCTVYAASQTYSRSCSCSSWGSYGSWGTTEYSNSCGVQVETQTAYGE